MQGLIFQKAMRCDASAARFSVGESVNLMATDTRTLARCYTFGHQVSYHEQPHASNFG